MPRRDIILTDLTKETDLFRLRDYLRELFTVADPRPNTPTFSATPTVDAAQVDTVFLNLTGNITGITINNPDTGRKLRFIFLQDGTGSRTVAGWPASVAFAGASFTPTATANKYSTVSFEYANSKWVEIARTLNVS